MRNRLSLLVWICLFCAVHSISTNNVCTFRTEGKLFTLTYLEMPTPYKIIDEDRIIYFNFCFAFTPPECPNEPTSFSFVLTPNANSLNDSNPIYKC